MVVQERIDPTSKDFVVKTSNRDLKSLEVRVKQLFDVDFQILPCQNDLNLLDETNGDVDSRLSKYESLQWIRIECGEDQGLLDQAKEYIISVCCPEVRCRVDFPVCDLFEERGSVNIVDEIERKTLAYLAVDSEGFLEICGSKMAVALATSSFDQVKTIHVGEKDCNQNQVLKDEKENLETEVVWKRREPTKPKVVKSSKANEPPAKECSFASERDNVKELKNTEISLNFDDQNELQNKDSVSTSLVDESLRTFEDSQDSISESQARSTQEHQGLESQNMIVGESLRDFARKLGYSESEVSSVLSKLGPEADNNMLLMELVKAQNSAKQIEEGSSLLERPLSSPPVVVSSADPSTFRAIVIDGSNVAMSHGNQKVFSCRGIGISVDYFIERGHREIKVFVPSWRKESSKPESPIIDQEVLARLEEDGILVWTPSRCINGRRVVCYDDRFIIKLAHQMDGIIVSNDNFRDLQNESAEWKKVIEQRLLMYSFVDDHFMPPDDPAGRHGPTLDEFLLKGCGKACPYGRRCTYGNRCKYLHPERNSKSEAEMLEISNQLAEKLFLTPPAIPYGETKTRCSSFRDASTQRQGRPLPPLPDMPAYLLTKPLPPTPKEIPPQRPAKPLPIPQVDVYHNMARLFPPTLRTNHSNPTQRPASDPLPQRQQYSEVNSRPEYYNRSLTRRGSLPPAMPSGPSLGYPSLPGGNGHYPQQMYPTHPNMAHPPDIPRGMVVPEDPVYGAHGRYQQPYQQVQPGYPGQHWGMTQFQQHHGQYPPQYHTLHPHYNTTLPHYPNSYTGGQGNGYFTTRAPPTGSDVTDGPMESSQGLLEEDRVKAYETLLDVFPNDAARILKVLDENPEESCVEKLTQLLLEEDDEK